MCLAAGSLVCLCLRFGLIAPTDMQYTNAPNKYERSLTLAHRQMHTLSHSRSGNHNDYTNAICGHKISLRFRLPFCFLCRLLPPAHRPPRRTHISTTPASDSRSTHTHTQTHLTRLSAEPILCSLCDGCVCVNGWSVLRWQCHNHSRESEAKPRHTQSDDGIHSGREEKALTAHSSTFLRSRCHLAVCIKAMEIGLPVCSLFARAAHFPFHSAGSNAVGDDQWVFVLQPIASKPRKLAFNRRFYDMTMQFGKEFSFMLMVANKYVVG